MRFTFSVDLVREKQHGVEQGGTKRHRGFDCSVLVFKGEPGAPVLGDLHPGVASESVLKDLVDLRAEVAHCTERLDAQDRAWAEGSATLARSLRGVLKLV